MFKIEMELEADPDGTLHVPLPPELRGEKMIHIVATLTAAEGSKSEIRSDRSSQRREE